MEVFRICRQEYANALTASGGANRWNTKGQIVIYTGSSRSLASLELIVHKASIVPAMVYKVMVILIADDDYLFKQIQSKDLPADWRTMAAYAHLQRLGSDWYTSQETLVLKVPSAVIPYEYNYIINADHPEFSSKVQLVRAEDYFWDSSYFKKLIFCMSSLKRCSSLIGLIVGQAAKWTAINIPLPFFKGALHQKDTQCVS